MAKVDVPNALLQLISTRELAEQWRCYPSTVSRVLEKAGIRPYFLGSGKNGMKRYRKDEVEVFMARRRAP